MAQSSQYNVNLNFNANTSQAKKAIQELNQELLKIQTQPNKGFDDTDLRKASQAAEDLRKHLSAAVNVNTGKMDLNKFSQSLSKSKQNLNDLYNDLCKIGPQGQSAFLKIAKNINQADNSMLNINAKVKEFGKSLANTARWQVSSSLLHGLMGAVQSAYGYAQDLNESLNNIRIVTGQSVNQMEKFAKEANKAAKALSTTTTEYTNASLIFFQQGLSEDEVAKRTATTIKMSNVTGESAQAVSDQLTSVWNNFYDGSKSLEYYADVMTALGAATASSSEEISEGLEKFAAVADTVGLSYEYAASALATVTATTRQSADVVGTAFKTLFARIQDLELGETLEDGTTLGKYSAALRAVGVNIKDTNGEMKDMDIILSELGEKWGSLSKDTQVALAQTLAGTRQYTQLVALMDNWDYFQENLSLSGDSSGTLDRQAEIYAESWEGAQDRVKAAAEEIYSSLLNDDFFIDILNGFEKFLGGIKNVIDGMGGLKGILLLVSGIFTQHFAKEIPGVLTKLGQNFDVITGKAQAKKVAMLTQQYEILKQQAEVPLNTENDAGLQTEAEVAKLTLELEQKKRFLSEAEIQTYENKIDNVRAYGEEAAAIGKEIDQLERLIETKERDLAKDAARKSVEKKANADSNLQDIDKEIKQLEKLKEKKEEAKQIVVDRKKGKEEEKDSLEDEMVKISNKEHQTNNDKKRFRNDKFKAENLELSIKKDSEEENELNNQIQDVDTKIEELKQKKIALSEVEIFKEEDILKQIKNLENLTKEYEMAHQIISKTGKDVKYWENQAKAVEKNDEATKKMKTSMSSYLKNLKKVGVEGREIDELIDKLENSDISAGEAAEEFKKLSQNIKKINGKELEDIEEELIKVADELKKMGVDSKEIDSLTEKFKSGVISAEEYQQALNKMSNAAEGIPERTMALSESFGVFAGKAMQVASAIQALQGIGDIWKDEDATTGEKILSTMSALIPVITLTTSLTNKKSLADLSAASSALLQAIGLGGLIPVKGAETAATGAQTAANVGLSASMVPVLIATLLITAAIVALVLIVKAIVKAFEDWKAATPEGRLAAAKEESSRLAEELDRAKQAADNLRQSIENYDTAVDKLHSLKKGTEEWRQALEEANAEARKIIEQGGLEGKYHFNINTGLIEFEDGALESAQAQADGRVNFVQNQKTMQDNNALKAENDLARKEARNGEAADTAAIVLDVVTAIQAVGSVATMGITSSFAFGTQMLKESILAKENAEDAALQSLVDAYEKNDGNFARAFNSLSGENRNLISQLGLTDVELQELCSASVANTAAILENTKQMIDNSFEDFDEYKYSTNKEFLNMALSDDLEIETEKQKALLADKSTDELREMYAKLMGYDPTTIEDKGDMAVYTDKDGNEAKVSDENILLYIAENNAMDALGETISQYNQNIAALQKIEGNLATQLKNGEITYSEYVQSLNNTGAQLGFTMDEMEDYLSNHTDDYVQRYHNEIALVQGMMNKFGLDYTTAVAQVQSFAKDLTNEDLQLSVDILATSDSLEDFKSSVEQKCAEGIYDALNNSITSTSTMLEEADEKGKFTRNNFNTLQQDDNFIKWLEKNHIKMADIISASYSEQYNIISKFYADVKTQAQQNLKEQKQIYEKDLDYYSKVLMYKLSGNEEFIEGLDKNVILEMDISDIYAKIAEAEGALSDLTDKQYEVQLSWDDVDLMEKSFDEAADFLTMINKDTKKVGNSYLFTAAQAKKWARVYPELFAEAQSAGNGMMKINEKEIQAFKKNETEKRNEAIDTFINNANLRKEEIKQEITDLNNELTFYTKIANGEVEVSQLTTQEKLDLKERLTQYYIDCGYDEVKATQQALMDMGIAHDNYQANVVKSAQDGADGMVAAANHGGSKIKTVFTAIMETLKKAWESIKLSFEALFDGNFTMAATHMKNAFAIWGTAWEEVKTSWDSVEGVTIDPQFTDDSAVISDEDIDKYTPTATYDPITGSAVQEKASAIADTIRAEIATLENELADLDAITPYMEALKEQDLEDYGNTDPNKEDNKDTEDLKKVADRYHEINKEIETMQHQLDILGTRKERAFGKSKLNLMKKEAEQLDSLVDKQKELMEAQQYMAGVDQGVVRAYFSNATFDEFGNITNYSDLENQATAEYNAAIAAYNNSEQTDYDKKVLEDAKKAYEDKMKALEQYEDTINSLRESEAAYEEAILNWQNANAEILNYELELEIMINDNDLQKVEYYLSKMEDDINSAAEALGLMIGSMSSEDLGLGGQLGAYLNKLEAYENLVAEAEKQHNAGKISDEHYQQILQTAYDGTYDELGNLQELIKVMDTAYSDTIDKMNDKLSEQTEKFEHLNSVLDHYNNLLGLFNKQNNYKAVGMVLESQAKVAEDRTRIAKQTMEMYQEKANERKALYDQALKDNNAEAAEVYLKEYEAALAAANEAEEEFLSNAEAWAEKLKEILENELKEAARELEKALTGGTSFDYMTTQMERLVSIQEEYLTTTNKIYETNKMMRTAQKEIDKSTNSVAKQRLKSFVEETKNLQNKNQLSQFELNIQQAKYDLIVAQMALEEAQNAKTTVRLQRDNEGNFGYVYTADTTSVNEAQQAMEDAQNKLYNVSLEGANNYAQKYYTTMQEMYETLKDLAERYRNGEFENEEEYNRAVQEAKEYYYEKLKQYSSLYNVAILADTNAARDHILGSGNAAQTGLTGNYNNIGQVWRDNMINMMDQAEDWQISVDDYVTQVSGSFSAWQTQCEEISQMTLGDSLNGDLEGLRDRTDRVTESSGELASEIRDDLLPELFNELGDVGEVTQKFNEQRGAINLLIQEYERLAAKYNEDLNLMITLDSSQLDNYTPPEIPDIEVKINVDDSALNKYNNYSGGSGGNNNYSSGNGSSVLTDVWNWLKSAAGNIVGGAALTYAMANAIETAYNNGELFKNERVKFDNWYTPYYSNSSDGETEGHFLSMYGKVVDLTRDANSNVLMVKIDTGFQQGWVSIDKLDPDSFDTGGYTGDWDGSYGKLAFLHQKEIILNAEDTQNLLASMEFLDNILQTIDLQSANAQHGGNIISPSFSGHEEQALEQNVHIEANFPNVTDRNEIQEAFKDIVNLASQYANRK